MISALKAMQVGIQIIKPGLEIIEFKKYIEKVVSKFVTMYIMFLLKYVYIYIYVLSTYPILLCQNIYLPFIFLSSV